MENLFFLLDDFKNKIPQQGKTNLSISKASIGWHIEHFFKSIIRMVTVMQNSNSNDYKWQFNKKRLRVLVLGKMPRGQVNAPPASLPSSNLTESSLSESFQNTVAKIKEINQLHPKQFIDHHVFGKLNVKNTKKIMWIHGNHHLKIIQEILNT